MPDLIVIRVFQKSDVDRIAALERLCNPMPWGSLDLASFAESETPSHPQRKAWVAEHSITKEVVGYVCIGIVAQEAEILILGVDPKYRRHGIGKKLLEELQTDRQAANFIKVFLEVRQSNAAALALYRGAEFTEVGRRKGYYADTGEDAVLMGWVR